MKIGMISFAHMHAFSYADGLKKIPNVELVGIFDDDVERGQQAGLVSMSTRHGETRQLK